MPGLPVAGWAQRWQEQQGAGQECKQQHPPGTVIRAGTPDTGVMELTARNEREKFEQKDRTESYRSSEETFLQCTWSLVVKTFAF